MRKFYYLIAVLKILCSLSFGQIISQYIDTESGSTPKGIEIWNNTESTLDFSTNNLVIEKGTNGDTPTTDYTLSNGVLASGNVIVIGTFDLQAVTEGNGSAFYSEPFTFNGDDALVVKYGGTIIDIFGTSGSDPGDAWSGSGVSTEDQNISLKEGITSGDTDGWTDPSLRFETISTTPNTDMSGFGIAPSSGSGTTAVQFSASSSTVTEQSGTYNLEVTITNPDGGNATTAQIALTSGSAVDINNYTTQTATFPAGSSENQTISITITDDSDIEDNETLTFSLQNVSGGNSATAGTPSSFDLTIAYNDGPNLVINEIHADPDLTYGDANNDGNVNSDDDEFVEIVNKNGALLDISGWKIYDGVRLKHTVPASTELGDNIALVVFSGGTPMGIPGVVQIASSGTLGLNNDGDDVILKNASDITITMYTYGSEGGDNQSIARNPDFTGDFVKHSKITGNAVLFSPGRMNVTDQSLPVTLTDFSAFYENGKVVISWITESELENLGFNLYRSMKTNDQFSMINDRLIPGAGSNSSRHEYHYADVDVAAGMTYYYRLEDVSLSGQTNFHGPVSVTIPFQTEQNSDDSGFYLGPNFPNPCNPRTEIQFVVAEPCQVTLEVYDLLGNRIKTLTDAGYDRGDYSLIWDGTDDQGHLVGSGVYFYRMMTDTGALLTRKLILLR